MTSQPQPRTGGSSFLVEQSSRTSKRNHFQELVLHGDIDKNSEPHPSTSRALVLRKAADGTGELAFSRKISGQEKLSLLANDMTASAIRAPFRLGELLKKAESQFRVHLDEIFNLKDKDSFCDDILATISSRIEYAPDRNGVRRVPLDDTHWVASVVGCRVHNVYLLAGAWRLVRNVLRELEAMGLDNADVRGQLRASERIRERYLVLYDIIIMLTRMGQQRVANIAAATVHYAPYFVSNNNHNGDMEFDHYGNNPRKIREAHQSFIDAILLELVLPGSEYPPYVLISLLHEAVEECRKEDKRFSQALWDSVGDFSVTVEVLDLVEGPLSGESWISDTGVSREFSNFLRVQKLSDTASRDIESWRIHLKPLIGTKKEDVMKQLWYNINKSYEKVGGIGIDDLWSLRSDLILSPQWSTYFIPELYVGDSDPDEHALVIHKHAKGDNNKLIEKGLSQPEDFDDDEVPALMTVSDDSDDDFSMSDFSENVHMADGDSESEYDPVADELLQDMLREALDTAIEMDLLEHTRYQASTEKSGNPFTRMFANLKGRYISADPALKADENSRNPFKARPITPAVENAFEISEVTAGAANSASGWDKESTIHPKKLKSSQSGSPAPKATAYEGDLIPPVEPLSASTYRRTQKLPIEEVEEVEDEDYHVQSSKKKVKKKKKKSQNYKSSVAQQPLSSPSPSTPSKGIREPSAGQPQNQTHLQSFQEITKPSKLPSTSPSPQTPSKTTRDLPIKHSSNQSSPQSSLGSLDPNFSRTSLPFAHETNAQSARAYMQSQNLTTEKSKVKSRPAFAGAFFKTEKELKKPKDSGCEKKGLLERVKKINLPKRIGDSMARLISSADGKTHAKKPMKWEEFLKVMRAMGFSYDPSTAGSSVRFDPPDPKDPSITFHKPHPDSTLHRNHLRDFGKRLKRTYGWSPEQFSSFGVKKYDDD